MTSMTTFSTNDIPDLSGRRVVITGANSGIGRSAAQALAAHGARVTLAVRDLQKGHQAAASMQGDTEVRRLDLADLSSVRDFAAGWQGEIFLLINNAGIMIPPLSRTADGFEMQFGTNHLGHFALTNLLLPQVSNWEHRRYRRWSAYGQSKLANLMFASELQRRLSEVGSDVISTAAHPGYAATNLQSHSGNPLTELLMGKVGNRLFAQDQDSGALPTLYAAVAAVPGGAFAGPSGFQESRGAPELVGRSKRALDEEVGRRLWTVSEELTGTTFPL
jgi:NAD(P)-dependent dehydrogenase (short-subunit alcohol dehydrogenase family)